MRRLVATFALVVTALFSLPVVAVPAIDHPVNDYAHVLSDDDAARISARIEATRAATGVHVALLIVDTTAGIAIDDYAIDAARQWGGGTSSRNDGVLVVFAVRDRHSDVEAGRGVEERLPDALTKRILDDARPALRAGRSGDAMLGVVTAIGEGVGATFRDRTPAARHRAKAGWTDGEIIAAIIVVGVLVLLLAWFFMRNNRRGGSGSDSWFFFWSDSGSGGSSGGSDWGGGGGDFGGGGSSSDW